MTGPSAERKSPSLLERAADHFDLAAALQSVTPHAVVPGAGAAPAPAESDAAADPLPEPAVAKATPPAPHIDGPAPLQSAEALTPPVPVWSGMRHAIDRDRLEALGIILPDGEITGTGEEFRIVKRRVLAAAFDSETGATKGRGNFVLVNSAHPGEGKTWCAINLAMSLAAEQDMDVLLVDADFGKPELCELLGLPEGPGFMDALVDPQMPIGQSILRTDVPSLSVLPAGRHVRNDTEFLASGRTRQVMDRLVADNARRIVIFDSPPALAASLASELARHVGQTVMVVRADRTSEAALRDAVNLIGQCPLIRLLLNGVKFSSSGRQFGTYYGKAAS
ncbi:AAA family ATPase [Sphingobium lignivorans]|uniref:Exopolysaccharide/PEP-CTERM locus tyrosine autokinase n=1 Tax=Sphingobium lignivorans TaxID=2735886 RepID=A0ABR6NGP8_9SPHN|nr:AAA family ATPase [Sphingobium lignivorans]MBB5986460.1 exopolysaccharide/PEP-CTERM locus tyrosine autokinase [Sphingobium lignivorans]